MLNVQELLNELEVIDLGYDLENYDGMNYISDAILEIADNNVSIYYSDIMDFIKDYTEEVERAIDEFGWDGCGGTLHKAGQMGEYLKHQDDLYANLEDALLNYAYKYYVQVTDKEEIDEELNDLIIDICGSNPDRFDDITSIIDEYINEEE